MSEDTRQDNHETKVACILKYLVKGVRPNRTSQSDLQIELEELLPNASSIVILPVVEGYSVEIEVSDVAPFSRSSFEPYVADHILREAVIIRCKPTSDIQLQLLRAHYR